MLVGRIVEYVYLFVKVCVKAVVGNDVSAEDIAVAFDELAFGIEYQRGVFIFVADDDPFQSVDDDLFG